MALAVPGCGGFRISSTPRGADVLVDGQAVGWKTPVGVRPGQLASGRHEITVSLPGYRVVETPWRVDVTTSTWKIVGAILLPIPFLFTGIGSSFKSTSLSSMKFTFVPSGSSRGDATVPGRADRRTVVGRCQPGLPPATTD
jgi:hypothetical protein